MCLGMLDEHLGEKDALPVCYIKDKSNAPAFGNFLLYIVFPYTQGYEYYSCQNYQKDDQQYDIAGGKEFFIPHAQAPA